MSRGEEVLWVHPRRDASPSPEIADEEIADAAARLKRFAPCIRRMFPETAGSGGIIESPLRDIPAMMEALSSRSGTPLRGRLMLKCDGELPISGSIKARGGIYEVLRFAERVARESRMLRETTDRKSVV